LDGELTIKWVTKGNAGEDRAKAALGVAAAEAHEVRLITVKLQAVLEEPGGRTFVCDRGLPRGGAVCLSTSRDATVIDVELEGGKRGGVGGVKERKERSSVKSGKDRG
jgi:hypothetical protein